MFMSRYEEVSASIKWDISQILRYRDRSYRPNDNALNLSVIVIFSFFCPV